MSFSKQWAGDGIAGRWQACGWEDGCVVTGASFLSCVLLDTQNAEGIQAESRGPGGPSQGCSDELARWLKV